MLKTKDNVLTNYNTHVFKNIFTPIIGNKVEGSRYTSLILRSDKIMYVVVVLDTLDLTHDQSSFNFISQS